MAVPTAISRSYDLHRRDFPVDEVSFVISAAVLVLVVVLVIVLVLESRRIEDEL